MTIEKTGQPHQVWSHGGSTLKKRKKEHKTAKIPALQKLTHIGHARSFGSLLVGWLVGGCGVRAVSRKTPIYLIMKIKM